MFTEEADKQGRSWKWKKKNIQDTEVCGHLGIFMQMSDVNDWMYLWCGIWVDRPSAVKDGFHWNNKWAVLCGNLAALWVVEENLLVVITNHMTVPCCPGFHTGISKTRAYKLKKNKTARCSFSRTAATEWKSMWLLFASVCVAWI